MGGNSGTIKNTDSDEITAPVKQFSRCAICQKLVQVKATNI